MYNVTNTSFTHYPESLRLECALCNAFDSPPLPLNPPPMLIEKPSLTAVCYH